MAAVAPIAHPYRDTHVIDRRAPRTNQAVVGLGALAAVVFGLPVLVALLALQLIVGLTLGRRYCLPCVLYFEVLQPRLGEGPLEDSRPPRFANVVGAGVLSAATAAHLLGWTALGNALALLVAALALLAATTGVCVGCELYVRWQRLRHRATGGAVARIDAGSPVIVFTSPYCLACKHWTRELDAARIAHAVVDVKERPDLAAGHEVRSTPTVLVLAGDGTEVRRATGELAGSPASALGLATA